MTDEVRPDAAWGFAIFADDLRNEVGGKWSLMGIYQKDLIVTGPTLPIILPKLVVVVMYYEIAGSITGDLNFKVHLPDDGGKESFSETIIQRDKIPEQEPKTLPDGSERVLEFRVPFLISPFVVFDEGSIKVRCYYSNGSLLRLGRLNLIWRKPKQRIEG